MGELKTCYTLDELETATYNFCESTFLGKSCYSSVYYAFLPNSEQAAVKKLDLSIDHDSDADFLAQVSVVSALNHEHLTGLLGYCMEDGNRYLVYQYATNATLYDVLYGAKREAWGLSWDERVKIMYGAAKGLEYLHEEVTPSIVHGDVRPSNVHIFDFLTSKIADFNLTRALIDDNAPRTISIRAPGSYGYDAPECATTGEITVKSDVYSFGVLLLEILTGRKPVDDTLPEEEQDLVTWATPYLSEDKVEHILDPRLDGDFPLEAVAKVAALAGLCIQDEPDFRPNMAIITTALEPLQYVPVSDEVETAISIKYYTLEELNSGTNNFSQMSLVSKGPYARVYRASFSDGQQAAIKKFDTSIPQCTDWDYLVQIQIVMFLHHEHYIQLLGEFRDDDNRYLVYEFATKGSLHDMLYGRKHVYGSEPGPVLTWAQRAKIAHGAAKGLEYLHEKDDPRIVHGDIRSSNVLLTQGVSDDYYPKIGDFNFTHVRHVLGMDGYSGPKDALERLNPKNDVYDFGVVLLELITGRKPVDNTMPEDQQDLVTWAIPYLSAENVEQIIDPKLNGDFSLDEVAKVAAIAGLCIQDEIDSRPNMSTVVGALQTLVEV
ncbi:uncharacterized protein LOC141642204 [Silene latifolia]|uniref:uncharacterized protein LOC141642204 n=1 Tax=Silene latifolia TaxID=37657 RepID=UPI003D7889CE